MPSVADICETEFESNSLAQHMNTNEQVERTSDEVDHQGGKAEAQYEFGI